MKNKSHINSEYVQSRIDATLEDVKERLQELRVEYDIETTEAVNECIPFIAYNIDTQFGYGTIVFSVKKDSPVFIMLNRGKYLALIEEGFEHEQAIEQQVFAETDNLEFFKQYLSVKISK